jgi:hypothetical protein
MPDKEIKDITDFFSEENPEISPEEKWNSIFQSWINKIEEKKMMLNLFELKLWFEALEAFFSSSRIERLIFKLESHNLRNYGFYLDIFTQIIGKLTIQLKTLDFKKDEYLLNFEEFIIEKILENVSTKSFPYMRDFHSPESWFYSLRIFLQNLKNTSVELQKNDTISQKTFSSLKKLYHKELTSNPIIISLLNMKFIPRMDKIFQKDISDIILSIEDKKAKKQLGIFFILSFRIIKINNFIELNLNKSRDINITIPLILALGENIKNIFNFYEKSLKNSIQDKNKLKVINEVINESKLEFKKIFEGELPYFFDKSNNKVNKRNLIKNIIIISDITIQDLIETIAKLFKPEISGINIFENYISRKEKTLDLKKKLTKLHTKINDYFSKKNNITPSEIFFDLNLFIENDLNFLLYKDWNEFLNHFNSLNKSNFSSEFDMKLKSFHSFITKLLKELIKKKTTNC